MYCPHCCSPLCLMLSMGINGLSPDSICVVSLALISEFMEQLQQFYV